MAKYIVLVAATAIISVTAYFGLSWYRSAMNTPERVVESFAQGLTRDETERTYERLSTELKEKYSVQQWTAETALFRKNTATPKLLSQESVNDTFNSYPKDGNPQRFAYKYRINDKDYVLSAVLYKQGNSWLVDEFQGDYK